MTYGGGITYSKAFTLLLGIIIMMLFFLEKEGIGVTEKKGLKMEKATFATPQINNMNVIPYELGIKQEFYKREGIELEYLLMKGAMSTIGLKTGDLDYSNEAGSTIMAAAFGLPLKAVMVSRAKSSLVLVARPGINSVKDLKGKVIGGGSSIGAGTDNAVRAILRYHGLDPDKDVIIRQTAGDIKMAVLLSGAVDAGIMSGTEGILLEKKGFKRLMSADDVIKKVSGTIMVSVKKLKENPEQIKKVIRGTLKAIAYVRNNRKETIDFMVKDWGLDRELAPAIYDSEKDGYILNGKAPDENFQAIIKEAQERGLFPAKKVPSSQLRDFTLLEEVLKEMGIK